MLREDLVFGPIFSRRFGSSLGINLLPRNGKLCNFDCIYCECGWNADGRNDKKIPNAADLREVLDITLQDCHQRGVHIDSITFSGDGEPTLNPDFEQMVDITLELRDKYYPSSVVTVLTNATRLSYDNVFRALRKVDNAVLKLDAYTDELVAIINKPEGTYKISEVLEGMRRFEGDFVLQTMFLHCPAFDSASEDQLIGWMNIVRELKPREVMVYTISRETPDKSLIKYTEEEMKALVQPLIDEQFNIKIYE